LSDMTKKIILSFVLIGVVLNIIINVNLNNRLKNLEPSLSNMSAGYSHLYNEINSLRWDILNKIDAINEQAIHNAKLSFGESASIQRYDISSSTAEIVVSFYLKEYNVGEKVSIMARGLSNRIYNC